MGNEQVRKAVSDNEVQELDLGRVCVEQPMDILILELTYRRLYISGKGRGWPVDTNDVIKELRYKCHRRRSVGSHHYGVD